LKAQVFANSAGAAKRLKNVAILEEHQTQRSYFEATPISLLLLCVVSGHFLQNIPWRNGDETKKFMRLENLWE